MTRLSEQYRPRTTRSLAIVTATRDSSSALSPAVTIERLRMALDRFHEPVLATEIVELFSSLPERRRSHRGAPRGRFAPAGSRH